MTTVDDPQHGRHVTYYHHLTAGTEPCRPCRDAAARYERGRQLDILNGNDRMVPKTGAVRRLRALQAIGWPRRDLSRRAGYTSDALTGILNGRRTTIRRITHDIVNDLYDELSMTPGPSQRTRAIALDAGWAPPLAWEGLDIDDPATIPDLGNHDDVDTDIDQVVIERILAGDPTPARTATPTERHLVVTAWPNRTGRTYKDLARLTGWEPSRYRTAPTTEENTAA